MGFFRCVEFYNKYSNPFHEERLRLIEKNNKLMKESTHLVAQMSDLQKELKEAKTLEEFYKTEIIKLKAKLYDMMEAVNAEEEEKTTP